MRVGLAWGVLSGGGVAAGAREENVQGHGLERGTQDTGFGPGAVPMALCIDREMQALDLRNQSKVKTLQCLTQCCRPFRESLLGVTTKLNSVAVSLPIFLIIRSNFKIEGRHGADY